MRNYLSEAFTNWKANHRPFLSQLPSSLLALLEHVLYFLGLASIIYGFWLARDIFGLFKSYPSTHPLGYLAAGVVLIYVAIQITAERAFAERTRRNKLED